ncbi:hypothetical protein [Streptococcus porcinus]|uniref:Membrane protein n=2 Tax=Streptococcus porcinus TaxID=1340 RepID=A0A4V0H0S2_STRPO|nr:hypothetical protein [Streptococcus porcinus]EGJ27683.1 conserved domain protein [Streptococcus porcinus str. Jelinkova 176]SQG42705.1 membrane protein [Streptococcus porcinus]VTT41725.1 membrane protein [Streptococcus porcinus]VTT42860.1 membrane protein [Streptococcus porcinus]
MNFRTKVLFHLGIVSSSVLLLSSTILPSVNVFADTITAKNEQIKELTEIAPNDNINLSEEKKQLSIQEVKNKYPNVSEEFISGVIENYLSHNYTFPREQARVFRSA